MAVVAFLFVPVLTTIIFSFNSGSSLVTFSGASLRWYRTLADDHNLRSSLWLSVQIAVTAALVATVLGTMLALGVQRGSHRLARTSDGMIFLRLVAPETATAVALLLMFTQLGVTLSTTTIVVGHVVLCLAFVAVIVRSRLAAINPEIEEAAMDLGASRINAFRLVVLPVLAPGITAAGLLAFVLSFDDFITSFFTSGLGVPPLPVRIYAMLRFGITPEINAVGMLMFVVTLVAVGLALVAMRLGRRSRQIPDGTSA